MTQHARATPSGHSGRFIVPLLVLGGAIALIVAIVPTARRPIRLAQLIASTPPDSLPVPVAGVRPSRLTDTWGAPRGGGRSHEGIDIFAKRNTPIRSTTDGVIASTDPNPLGGECIVVLGPGGYRHYYAHLHRHGRYREGDWIKAGDTIGYVGNTGNARTTPPHLHYGIYTPAGPVNPYPLLTRGRPVAVAKAVRKKASPTARRNAQRARPGAGHAQRHAR